MTTDAAAPTLGSRPLYAHIRPHLPLLLQSMSFGTVDSIARYSLDLPPDHPVRARAALLEAFAKAAASGHTARAKIHLIRDTALLLRLPELPAASAQKPASLDPSSCRHFEAGVHRGQLGCTDPCSPSIC